MLVEAKRQFFTWLQNQFTDCEVIFSEQTKEPAGTSWLRVYILKEFTNPSHSKEYTSELQVNFSIFTNDFSNIYILDILEEKLRCLIEKRKLCFDAGTIEFREFDTANLLTQPTEQIKMQRIIKYKSIMATAYICSVRR